MSVGGQERPLGLFEVLARNRQSALGLSCRTSSTPEQPLRMFTILPRQQLSLTTRLVLRRRNFTHLVINTHTHAKERHTERKKYTIYACKKRDTLTLISVSETSPEKQSKADLIRITRNTETRLKARKQRKAKAEREVYLFFKKHLSDA